MSNSFNRSFFLILAAIVCSKCSAKPPPERFQRLDRNGDGHLTPDELPGEVFKEIDTNRDSVVTVAEAIAWAQTTTGTSGQTARAAQNAS